MSHTAETGHDDHGHFIIPISTYLKTFVALMVLLVLTFVTARVHLPGWLPVIVMLAIATLKALLVIMYFMGVRYNTKLTWVWAAIGFVFLLLMFGTLMDHMTRPLIPDAAPW
jgi:cytochrome c oxidase subunit 4